MQRASRALLLNKFGNLSMRDNLVDLVVTSAYVRPYSLWVRGGGESQANPSGGGDAIFSWREIAQCFWATIVFLGGKSHDHRCF